MTNPGPPASQPEVTGLLTAGCQVRRGEWEFPGTADQVRAARRVLADFLGDCPWSDDAVLCLSELATNAVRHSASGQPGGTFTVAAEVLDDGVVLEVRDAGGPWPPATSPDGRMHGLGIVAELTARLSFSGDPAKGRTVVAHLGSEPADLAMLTADGDDHP
jgi:anti-sigma regulatory factor (Ser/Thr protein kinase)